MQLGRQMDKLKTYAKKKDKMYERRVLQPNVSKDSLLEMADVLAETDAASVRLESMLEVLAEGRVSHAPSP